MSSYFWWALGYDANWIEETPPALMRAQMDTLQKIRAQDWMLKPHLTRQLAITEEKNIHLNESDFADASESESESESEQPEPVAEPPKRDWSTAPVGRTIKKRA
jgi:hypothetical protein